MFGEGAPNFITDVFSVKGEQEESLGVLLHTEWEKAKQSSGKNQIIEKYADSLRVRLTEESAHGTISWS